MSPQVAPQHRDWLINSAISDMIIQQSGVYSVMTMDEMPEPFRGYGTKALNSLIFPWSQNGTVEPQLGILPDRRWKDAEGKVFKYRQVVGGGMLLNCLRDNGNDTVILAEGTKQHLAVASYTSMSVYGFAGAYNWTKADLSFVTNRDVVVIFDGDMKTNRAVYDAAVLLAESVELLGATSVKFAMVPTTEKDGIDDFLARQKPVSRPIVVANLISRATSKLPKAPNRRKPHEFFGDDGLLVEKLSKAIQAEHPAALTREGKIAIYGNGVYNIDGLAFIGAVTEKLGEMNRPSHRAAAEEHTLGLLVNSGLMLPERPTTPWVNVQNGMLDWKVGELHGHDPKYLSYTQFPVEWSAASGCPVYEQWLKDCVGDQVDDLEEVTATMLDATRTPTKALFLYGPSRSGKSTFLRLMQAIAGQENTSAVTLHQLAEDRFAAANVYGMVLNCAADLSASHVEDLSIFKMMTGEDPIQANRKFGKQFTFLNQALFAFSANNPPTVGENSRAYSERIKPVKFPNSFAGHEDDTIELHMLQHELPGIFRRWIAALDRMRRRGGYLPTDSKVRAEFEAKSDRVRQFVQEACRVTGQAVSPGSYLPASEMTSKTELAEQFNKWAERQANKPMGRDKILSRLTSINGVVEVRSSGKGSVQGKRGLNLVVRPMEEWGEDEQAEQAKSPYLPLSRSHSDLSTPSPEPSPSTDGQGGVPEGVKKTEGYGGSSPTLPALPVPDGDAAVTPPVSRRSDGSFDLPYPLPTTQAELPPCPWCGCLREAVPPTGFWYACRQCSPATFDRN